MATPVGPDRPKLRDRYARKQQQVVESAAKVFAERGYDQTSIQELAEVMGIAAGGIYHYFPSKEQLLVRICDQIMDPLLDEARELAGADLDPVTHFRALVGLWVGQTIDRRAHMLVFQQERHVIEHGAQWREVRARRKEFELLLDAAVEQVQAAGALASEDKRITISALLGMVNHTPQWYRPRGRLSAEEIAEGYVNLVLRA